MKASFFYVLPQVDLDFRDRLLDRMRDTTAKLFLRALRRTRCSFRPSIVSTSIPCLLRYSFTTCPQFFPGTPCSLEKADQFITLSAGQFFAAARTCVASQVMVVGECGFGRVTSACLLFVSGDLKPVRSRWRFQELKLTRSWRHVSIAPFFHSSSSLFLTPLVIF